MSDDKKTSHEGAEAQRTQRVPDIRFEEFRGEWEERKLEDVAVFNPKASLPPSFKYVDLESVVGTSLVSIQTENKETAPSRAQRLAVCKDIFFQTVRPYQRNNFLFDLPFDDFVFSSGYAQLRPNIDSYFLFNIIQKDEFVFKVFDYCTGTGYPAITPTNLALIEIFISLDIKEQTVIGNFFRFLDNTITLKKQQHEKTQNIKKAMLEKMFPKKGEDVPEIRFDGFTGTWEQQILTDILSPTVGNNTLSRDALNYDNGEVKNIHYGDILIRYGAFVDTANDNIPYITNGSITDYKSQLLKNGDIIFADTAEDETVGKVIEISNSKNINIVSGLHTMVYRPKQKFANYFLGYYLNANAYHQQLLPLMQGIKVLSLSRNNLSKTLLCYPTSIEEQTAIGNFFRSLDTLIEAQQQEIEKLQNIKKALLNKMFV